MSRKEGFLDRWSRLKQTDEAPVEPPEAESPATLEEAPADERSDEDVLAELGLPHPDDLKPGDDVTGFMAKAVPDRLRRMALRRLWRSNPILANVDGLVEYGEDYTDSAMVVENLQTLYRVGEGMFRKTTEGDAAAEDDEEPDVAEVGAGDGAEDGAETGDAAAVEREPLEEDATGALAGELEAPAATRGGDAAAAEAIPQPARRRMRFS